MLLAVLATGSTSGRTAAQELIWQWEGEPLGDAFGRVVAGGGDANGDGFPDVLVSDSDNDEAGNQAGKAYLYSGATGALLGSFLGTAATESLSAATFVGDVDSDGYDDFLLGAPGANEGIGDDQGRVDLYSGLSLVRIDTLPGPAPNSAFGVVSSAGDVNGDGTPDFAVGAPNYGVLPSHVGTAYVYSGMNRSLLHTFVGETSEDGLGSRVAGTGDLDGDDHDDILIRAPLGGLGETSDGRIYAYSGSDGSLLYTITGNVAASLGAALAPCGDLDQDRIVDFIAGAPLDNSARGSAYVYSGGNPGQVIYSFSTIVNFADFGFAAAGVGDVNADGVPDLVIGAPGDNSKGLSTGAAYLYSGRNGALLYKFLGEAKSTGLGGAVAGAGDVNGDGFSDFIVGAPSHKNALGQDVGGAYVYSGNDLFLQPDKETYSAGDPVQLFTRGGEPGTPAWVFLVSVNGIPLLSLLGAGILDSTGAWTFPLLASVPPELEGSFFECRSFSTRPLLGDQPRIQGKKLLPAAKHSGGFELIDSANARIDVPDPCSPDLGSDCNQNGVLDSCDIASGVSLDLDLDGVPDECRVDIQVPLDFLTIQEALDFAVDGAVITVADGTYTGPGNSSLDFQGKALTLRSANGPQNCILDLAGAAGFLFQSGETQSSVVQGFTVTNGNRLDGGAVFCNAASPTLEHCIFLGNTASERGGAVHASQSDLVLRNCVFAGNVASLEHGGAVALEGGNPSVRHCTFVGNVGQPFFGKGGALYLGAGTLAVNHCIFWSNFAGLGRQLFAESTATLSVDWCDVEGGWGGSGQNNLALDPLFVNPAASDYHLGATSPCIDAGDPAFTPLPGETDLDGEPRLQGAAVDLGADETVP